jgi:hypothetical protein
MEVYCLKNKIAKLEKENEAMRVVCEAARKLKEKTIAMDGKDVVPMLIACMSQVQGVYDALSQLPPEAVK